MLYQKVSHKRTKSQLNASWESSECTCNVKCKFPGVQNSSEITTEYPDYILTTGCLAAFGDSCYSFLLEGIKLAALAYVALRVSIKVSKVLSKISNTGVVFCGCCGVFAGFILGLIILCAGLLTFYDTEAEQVKQEIRKLFDIFTMFERRCWQSRDWWIGTLVYRMDLFHCDVVLNRIKAKKNAHTFSPRKKF